MSDIDILGQIFREELDDDALVISPDLSREDLQTWDSLAHVRIIAAIEERFDFQFSLSEIEDVDTVGGLLAIIAAHRA
jgi:acyl carrier protein